MSNYKPYPASKNTPSRKSRKSDRNKIFIENKLMKHKLKKERKANESVYQDDNRS